MSRIEMTEMIIIILVELFGLAFTDRVICMGIYLLKNINKYCRTPGSTPSIKYSTCDNSTLNRVQNVNLLKR